MTPMETITDLKEETLEQIKDLVCINKDSAEGFKDAAQAVDDPKLRDLFTTLSVQRQRFAEELQTHVQLNDKDAKSLDEVNGSWKGMLHRWWLDLRGKLNSGDAYAVLAEAERGEDKIKAMYEDVIKNTTGSPVSDVLHRQYAEVKAGHDTIRDLRDKAKAAK